MNLIYFTSGQVLSDGEIRCQALRIPEVLASIQTAQPGLEIDLHATLLIDEEFDKLSEEFKSQVYDLIQEGLFLRFCRFNLPYVGAIRRSDYPTASAAAKELRWVCRTSGISRIFVIGPGIDEIPLLIKDKKAPLFIDTIDHDPDLTWFWPELKKAMNA